MPSLPKLSYVLLSHNREQYIRQALESAFAQDYEGELEYIISDDCSTDRTFDIIQDCVAAYKGGRRVAVTRTPRNLHLAGNTNHAIQFVDSDWIVRADDDDISARNRCTLVGQAISRYPQATMIFGKQVGFTDAEEPRVLSLAGQVNALPPHMEEDPLPLSRFFQDGILHQAWSMRHFREFGPLPSDGQYVDDLISFYRCCMLGSGVLIEAPLAFVRRASNNMSLGGDTGGTGYRDIVRQELFTQSYNDITRRPLGETLQQLASYTARCTSRQVPEAAARAIISHLRQAIEERNLLCRYWQDSSFKRLEIRRAQKLTGLFSLLRCLPLPIFAAALSTYRYLFKR